MENSSYQQSPNKQTSHCERGEHLYKVNWPHLGDRKAFSCGSITLKAQANSSNVSPGFDLEPWLHYKLIYMQNDYEYIAHALQKAKSSGSDIHQLLSEA